MAVTAAAPRRSTIAPLATPSFTRTASSSSVAAPASAAQRANPGRPGSERGRAALPLSPWERPIKLTQLLFLGIPLTMGAGLLAIGAVLVVVHRLFELAVRGLRPEHPAEVLISIGLLLASIPLGSFSMDWAVRLSHALETKNASNTPHGSAATDPR